LTTKENYYEQIKTLNKWAYSYYTLDTEIVPDSIYDELYFEVKAFEETSGLVDKTSPTQRVGDQLLSGFEKSSHLEKMYSLDDVFNEEEFLEWANKIKKEAPEAIFYQEPKYDGLSLNLLYNEGNLIKATTRGDGSIGENVTANAPHVLGVPLNIPFLGKIEIRGEVVIFKDDLPDINAKRLENGKTEFSNPRNAASGSLRSFESSAVKNSKLRFTPYGLSHSDSISFSSQKESYDWIISLGFVNWNPALNCKLFSTNPNDMISDYLEIIKHRQAYPMLLDGMVIKIDQKSLQEDLGFTNKFPKWGIAFKFPAEAKKTSILDIILQVGKTGAITPVAIVEPTTFDGVTVQRVTLHNFEEIERKDIRIGDKASLIRSGDVIPKIIHIYNTERTGSETIVNEPLECPVCGSSTEHKQKSQSLEESSIVYCSNIHCPAILKGRIEYAVGKKSLDLPSFGEAAVASLVDSGKITKISDIFNLNIQDFLDLEGFKQKKSQNLIDAIQNSIGSTEVYRVLNALDIPQIGETASKKLAAEFGLKIFDTTNPLTYEDIIAVNDIGHASASAYVDFIQTESIEVDTLVEIIQPLEPEEEILDSNLFENKTFVITGTLSESRPFFASIVEANGGKVSGSVSKKTDYLLAGENAGSKLEKAKKIGVTTLTEEEFNNLLS